MIAIGRPSTLTAASATGASFAMARARLDGTVSGGTRCVRGRVVVLGTGHLNAVHLVQVKNGPAPNASSSAARWLRVRTIEASMPPPSSSSTCRPRLPASREVKPTRTRQGPRMRVSAVASSGVVGRCSSLSLSRGLYRVLGRKRVARRGAENSWTILSSPPSKPYRAAC